MQSDWNQIYKLTAEKTGKSEAIYKDLGNFVFKNLSNNLKRPKKLIVKLKGVGSWYLRRNRILLTVELFPPNFQKLPDESSEWHQKIKTLNENKAEIFALFQDRIKDYEKYIEQKSQIRKVRNETQRLLEPPTEED